MFRQIVFYDNYTSEIVSAWWLYLLLGLNLILLAVLILLFPPLVAYLIAAFLIFDGAVFLLIAYRLWQFKRHYREWRESLWEPLI
ncbi:MAG TPA: hypothetical protein VNO14_06710 [Blastocatellia bacterium]|nr:hypothetical protein [Blastocatellia bacterium]